MALIPHVYLDAGLTDQFDDATDTLPAQAVNAASGTGSFWVGTTTATNKIQDATNPGIDQLVASITDSAPASGVETTDIRLALSEAGLAGATPGASLNIGATILGGSANAVRVWYQWDNIVGAGTYTEISLNISDRIELAQ